MQIKTIVLAALVTIFMIIPAKSDLGLVMNEISPYPIEPGRNLTLSITLTNDNSEIRSLTLEIIPDSPIKLKNTNDRIVDIGTITKNSAYVKTYNLYIDPLTVSGTYNIKFKADWSDDSLRISKNKTFNLMAQGTPQITISNITIDPEPISPKDKFNITFSISNDGTGEARDIIVAAKTEGLPFISDGSDTKIIKKIDPDNISQLSFGFMVKDNAEISSYSIPINLNYKNENGNNQSLQTFVGIKILGNAKLGIANIKTDPLNPTKGDIITITMRIENSGYGDAKFVKSNIDVPFEGTKTAFVGKIENNDDAPVVFTLYSTQSGNIPISATIFFEDDFGTHNITERFNLYIRDTNKNSSVMILIGIFILSITSVLYLYYRKVTK